MEPSSSQVTSLVVKLVSEYKKRSPDNESFVNIFLNNQLVKSLKHATENQLYSELEYLEEFDISNYYIPLNIPFNLNLFKTRIENETNYFKSRKDFSLVNDIINEIELKKKEIKSLSSLKERVKKVKGVDAKRRINDRIKVLERLNLKFTLDSLENQLIDTGLLPYKKDGVDYIPVVSYNSTLKEYKEELVYFNPDNWAISFYEDRDDFDEFLENLTREFVMSNIKNDLKDPLFVESFVTDVINYISSNPSIFYQYKRFHEMFYTIAEEQSQSEIFELQNVKFYFKSAINFSSLSYRINDVANFENFYIRIISSLRKMNQQLSEGYSEDVILKDGLLFVGGFNIISFNRNLAGGKKIIKTIYETEEIDGSDNLCAYNALSTVYPYIEKRIFTIDELISFIKSNELKVSVIDNELLTFPQFELKTIEKIIDDKKVNVSQLKKINHNYIYECKDAELVLLYDYDKEHVDIIKGNKKVYKYKNIYEEIDGNLKVLYDERYFKKTKKINTPLPEYFAFYDFETIMQWGMKMVPYSFVILLLTKEELIYLNELEKSGTKEEVREYARNRSTSYSGNLCGEIFLDFIDRNSDKKMIFTSFNGSNFDNLLLYDILAEQLCKNNKLLEIQGLETRNISYFLRDCFWVGTKLMNFRIDGKHTTLDLRRHIPNSLKGCCKDFGLKIENSKTSFDHADIQEKFNSGMLLNEDGTVNVNIEELEDYNLMDVVSLAIVAQRYFEAYNTIISNVPENLIKLAPKQKLDLNVGKPWEYMTSSSMMFAIWNKYIKDNKIEISNFDEEFIEYYNLIRKYRVGGRCDSLQYFKKQFEPVNESEKFFHSLDVCSEYPFVMMILNKYYPTGKNVKCNYIDHPKNKIGFYRVKNIDQSNLQRSLKIVPNKTIDGNSWHSEDIIEETFLSTEKIELLEKHNVKFEASDGFYCNEKIKSFEMFLPLFVFKNAKDAEDIKPDDKMNGSVRTFSKIMMNSLSGKMNENIHLDKVMEVSAKEYLVLKHNDKIIDLEIIDIRFGKFLVSYSKVLKDCIKQSRAIHIGQLIYDYSHIYMYEHVYTKIPDYYYTDTDSAHCLAKDFKNWKEYAEITEVPHHTEIEGLDIRYKTFKLFNTTGKIFGSFEDELFKKNVNTAIMCGKKQYIYYNSKFDFENCNNEKIFNKNCKYSAKGISSNDRIVEKDFICAHEYERDKKKNLPSLMPESDKKADQKNFEAYQRKFKIGDNPSKLFEELIDTQSVKTLVFGIDKSIKNDSKGRKHCTLHAKYFVKDIRLSQNTLTKVVINDNNFYYIE